MGFPPDPKFGSHEESMHAQTERHRLPRIVADASCTASLSGDAPTLRHTRYGLVVGTILGTLVPGPLVPASAGAQLTDLLLAGRECNGLVLNGFANGAVFCVNCCEAVGLAAGWAATLSKGEPSAKARIGSRRVHENKSKPLIFCQRHL